MTRKDIYSLNGDALMSFYNNVIKEFNEHKKLQSEINNLNNKIENCKLRIYRLQLFDLLIIPILISIISSIFGLCIIKILNNLLNIKIKSNYLILLGFFIFSILIIFKLTNKNSKQKRKNKKLQLISNQLIPLQHQKQEKMLELNNAVNSQIYHDALLIFDDSLNVKLITQLYSIVQEGRADNHKDAIAKYYKDLQFNEAQIVEIIKIMTISDMNDNIKLFNSEMEHNSHYNK